MRIAQVAPIFESVPPETYGGTERVAYWLVEEMVKRGHDVTLFASGDSKTSARLIAPSEKSNRLDPDVSDREHIFTHTVLLQQVANHAHEFDIIHFHLDCIHYPLVKALNLKTVTTLHERMDKAHYKQIYREFPDIPLVSISDFQRKPMPDLNYVDTIYHGMPKDLHTFNNDPEDYVLSLGRLAPVKNTHLAIEIAVKAGMKIKVAGKIDTWEQWYFDEKVKPLLDHPLVDYLGEIDPVEKNVLLENALAFVFPIEWPEPFGLVMIESMASGTPTIAFKAGSTPEVIDDGISGFIVKDIDDAVEKVKNIKSFDRKRCREQFDKRFTVETMVDNHIETYKKQIKTLAEVSKN